MVSYEFGAPSSRPIYQSNPCPRSSASLCIMHNNQRECPGKTLSLPVTQLKGAVYNSFCITFHACSNDTVACTWPTLFCTHTSISTPRHNLLCMPKPGGNNPFSYSVNICTSHSLALVSSFGTRSQVSPSDPWLSAHNPLVYVTDQTKSSSWHLAETSFTPHSFLPSGSNSIKLCLQGPGCFLSVNIITATWRKSAFLQTINFGFLGKSLAPSATIRPRTGQKRRWPVPSTAWHRESYGPELIPVSNRLARLCNVASFASASIKAYINIQYGVVADGLIENRHGRFSLRKAPT